jgi:hypothetical protein
VYDSAGLGKHGSIVFSTNVQVRWTCEISQNPTKSKNILPILIQVKKKSKNTEGPLRPILRDKLIDARPKLPLRFSKKKIIQFGKI